MFTNWQFLSFWVGKKDLEDKLCMSIVMDKAIRYIDKDGGTINMLGLVLSPRSAKHSEKAKNVQQMEAILSRFADLAKQTNTMTSNMQPSM